jgi:hypothetical protein
MAATKLPFSLQERIMFFAGDIPGTPATKEAIKIQPSDSNELDVLNGTAELSLCEGDCKIQSDQDFLSPSDMYLLTQNDGPGFVVIDNFLGVTRAQVIKVFFFNVS